MNLLLYKSSARDLRPRKMMYDLPRRLPHVATPPNLKHAQMSFWLTIRSSHPHLPLLMFCWSCTLLIQFRTPFFHFSQGFVNVLVTLVYGSMCLKFRTSCSKLFHILPATSRCPHGCWWTLLNSNTIPDCNFNFKRDSHRVRALTWHTSGGM